MEKDSGSSPDVRSNYNYVYKKNCDKNIDKDYTNKVC